MVRVGGLKRASLIYQWLVRPLNGTAKRPSLMEGFEGCPGSREMSFKDQDDKDADQAVGRIKSQLGQWPIQMHLISPTAPYYQNTE